MLKSCLRICTLIQQSPAAEALLNLFTFVACRSIMLEIEGYDNEGGSCFQHPVWVGLQDALATRKCLPLPSFEGFGYL
jgi:hypothetical protein